MLVLPFDNHSQFHNHLFSTIRKMIFIEHEKNLCIIQKRKIIVVETLQAFECSIHLPYFHRNAFWKTRNTIYQ